MSHHKMIHWSCDNVPVLWYNSLKPPHIEGVVTFIKKSKVQWMSLSCVSHLSLALLAIDNLGWDDLGGSGLGSGAKCFGLGDNHLGDGSGGCDDGGFSPLHGLKALLTLMRTVQTNGI